MRWFKSKTYPEFWNSYANSFHKKYSLEDTRFVVFDTETTGLNPKQDRLLSIGTVTIINFQIDVADQLECYIKQEHFNTKTVEIHGILKEGSLHKIEEKEAIKQFLKHIERTSSLVHLVDCSMLLDPYEALDDYATVKNELLKYKEELGHKPEIVCLTKIDAMTEEEISKFQNINFRLKVFI